MPWSATETTTSLRALFDGDRPLASMIRVPDRILKQVHEGLGDGVAVEVTVQRGAAAWRRR